MTILRDAAWLTIHRARAYALILLTIEILVGAGWIGFSHGLLDPAGKPLGTDFLSFWSAGSLALQGHATSVYDASILAGLERATIPGPWPGYFAFFYPPTYLLLCAPLALLPYGASLLLWLTLSLALYLTALRRLVPQRLGIVVIFAFPAIFSAIGHGQNALLLTAAFTAALCCLPSKPGLAGLLLGCVACKPQFAMLIPILLIAERQWRALLGAIMLQAVLAVVALVLFGAEIWPAFLATTTQARVAMEQELMGAAKMVSIFGGIRLLHGSVGLAWLCQGLVASLVVIDLLRRRGSRIMALPTATLLATPFALDYDLALLALPLAWVYGRGIEGGFLPWEKLILGMAYVLPMLSRLVATATFIPLAPVMIMLLHMMVLRRISHRSDDAPSAFG